jgi:hypothetical protein
VVSQLAFDFARGFEGNVLPPVSFDDALRRVCAYCTDPTSGWATYDLCGVEARLDGHFETVTPWSLLWADALAGQVQVGDIARFSVERRENFAHRLISVPAGVDLNNLDDTGRAAVIRACQFGFAGVWGPKTTKVAALFRPQAIPVLDGYVALAFGFPREGFSEGREPRWARIERVINALSATLDEHRESLGRMRQDAADLIPDLSLIPNLRLVDIIIWTSQDDRMTRPRKPGGYWVNSDFGERLPITRDEVAPVSLKTGRRVERELPPGFGRWPAPWRSMEPSNDLPAMHWVELDLRELGEYEAWNDQPWHDRVPWAQVMEALRPYVVPGTEVDHSITERLLPGLPRLVKEGVMSLFREPLGIQSDGRPIGGGHRMLAMKRQGLTHAFGME